MKEKIERMGLPMGLLADHQGGSYTSTFARRNDRRVDSWQIISENHIPTACHGMS